MRACTYTHSHVVDAFVVETWAYERVIWFAGERGHSFCSFTGFLDGFTGIKILEGSILMFWLSEDVLIFYFLSFILYFHFFPMIGFSNTCITFYLLLYLLEASYISLNT